MKLALLALLFTGCALDELDLGESQQDVMTSNKLASNKLASNKLASNKLAANKLAAASFATGQLARPLVENADGREVLTYLVACALGPTQSVAFTSSTGTAYKFTGEIGIAPAWTTRALTLDEQRWTSACVFARTNYYGIPVALSIRGHHPALGTTSGDLAYTSLDGGFYGNLFDPTGPKEYACDGRSTNTQRICADPAPDGVTTNCGFTFTGMCGGLHAACDFASDKCRITLNGPLDSTVYAQVAIVYLMP
ncbi:MAG: hypothetical protein ABI678_30190 [Kofleriaceae bacterium]